MTALKKGKPHPHVVDYFVKSFRFIISTSKNQN